MGTFFVGRSEFCSLGGREKREGNGRIRDTWLIGGTQTQLSYRPKAFPFTEVLEGVGHTVMNILAPFF